MVVDSMLCFCANKEETYKQQNSSAKLMKIQIHLFIQTYSNICMYICSSMQCAIYNVVVVSFAAFRCCLLILNANISILTIYILYICMYV